MGAWVDLCERQQTWDRRKESRGQVSCEAVFSSPLCLPLQGRESHQGHLWLQWWLGDQFNCREGWEHRQSALTHEGAGLGNGVWGEE